MRMIFVLPSGLSNAMRNLNFRPTMGCKQADVQYLLAYTPSFVRLRFVDMPHPIFYVRPLLAIGLTDAARFF
jgi:hypothetical protein